MNNHQDPKVFIFLKHLNKIVPGGDIMSDEVNKSPLIDVTLIPIMDIIKEIKEIFTSYVEKREKAKEKRLEQLKLTLEVTTKITEQHLNLIKEITAPITKKKDFLTTFDRFELFVTDDVLPDAYGKIKGFLLQAYDWPEAKKHDELKGGLHKLRVEITKFQYTAYFIRREEANKLKKDLPPNTFNPILQTYDAHKFFKETKRLYDMFSNPNTDKQQITQYSNSISGQFVTAFGLLNLPHDKRPITTLDDLTSLSEEWFSAWQLSVQKQYHSGYGISGAIGELEAMILKY